MLRTLEEPLGPLANGSCQSQVTQESHGIPKAVHVAFLTALLL